MKSTTGLFASFVVMAVLVLRPGLASADVVPPRKAKADKDAAAVETRLASIGVDSTTARSSADHLTPSELRFFAEDPSRIQNVGGLTWYEVLGGVAIGGAVALATLLLAMHAEQ
jgi:hypothetical protein